MIQNDKLLVSHFSSLLTATLWVAILGRTLDLCGVYSYINRDDPAMRSILCLFVLTAAVAAAAQTRTFRWQDELCTYQGTYNAGKVSLAQLKNTLELARPGSYSLGRDSTVWKFEDIERLDVSALDVEFKSKSAQLKALDVVPTPYWLEFKSKKLRELEQVYNLERVTVRGYKDHSALLEYTAAPACTAKFARPIIAGGDTLIAAWQQVNEESRIKNADPERIRRIYENQLKSPDRLRFALLEVMAFGWSNCANALIEYVVQDETPIAEYKKLFVKVKTIRCDEP
jgi:hypothetical protein